MVGKKSKDEIQKAPSPSFCKLNFERASKGNPGRSSGSCVLRDHHGNILKALSSKILDETNNLAEVRALKDSVKLALSLGISKLHIEGDSQIVTSTLSSKKVVIWDLQYALGEVWKLLPRFQEFKISHCFREANQFFDCLANLGAGMEFGSKLFDRVSI